MRRLSDAGMRVFAERGYHQSRVDDIVRAARTSHGTFYLYFANKEDLLRALAVDCAQEMESLAGELGPIDDTDAGFERLREFLGRFVATYRRYGVVIRAWMEDQVSDREVDRLGVRAFTHIANALGRRMQESGAVPSEDRPRRSPRSWRCSSGSATRSRRATWASTTTTMLTSVTRLVHRGFFGADRAA